MGNKILVLGGSGLLGRNIVRVLKERGYENVVAASRSINNADITNPDSIDKLVSEADCVINAAGFIAFLHRDREKLMNVNFKGAVNVLKLCEKHEKRLIHVSSVAAFGVSDAEITEDTQFDENRYSHLAYAYSKYRANPEINKSSCKTNIIFPPLIFGSEDDNTKNFFNMVKGKKSKFVPNGSNAYIDVRDLADGIVRVLEDAKNKANYIISNENISIKTLFSGFSEALGQHTKFIEIPRFMEKVLVLLSRLLQGIGFKVPSDNVFFGFQKRRYSTEKIERDLKFFPKYKLPESLKWVADSDRLIA